MANGAGLGALMGMGLGIILVGIIVGLIVGTLILMLATKLVEKFTPSFGKALVTQIVAGIVGFIVAIVLGLVLGMTIPARLAAGVVNFFVCAWVIQQLITRPGGGAVSDGGAMAMAASGKMSYGRACLIALIEYIIYILIGVIVLLVFGGAMLAALHH
ncbi:MAG: hypothetical protein ACTHMO_02980 [Rhodanobacteraceae bacterium]